MQSYFDTSHICIPRSSGRLAGLGGGGGGEDGGVGYGLSVQLEKFVVILTGEEC